MNLEGIKGKITESKLGAFFGKLSKKTKILIIAAIVAIIAVAVVVAFVLNRANYVVLFSDVSEEEATQIVGKLQEDEIDYQYKEDGTILVEESVADQTRADLVYEGYPESGFTYDVFTENAGGMTTDSEKQTYKLYELQNRIGATVGLFDGVKDAKVTIALKEEQKYALESDDDDEDKSSASVVVTMEDGGSPTSEQAAAIQRLVAKSVPNMELTDVAVFDGNGIDVSADSEDGSSASGDEQEIAALIENDITKKVVNVLSPFYGSDNIRVSAKGTVDMERVVRESTTYETPEKIDEDDKRGLISNETITEESNTGGSTAGGVAGTETNADVSEYTTTTDDGTTTYTNNSQVREYLVNQIKEQGELEPGTLSDLTVAVSVNGNTLGNLTEAEAISLIGSATGIARAQRSQKITVVAAPFYEEAELPEDQASTLVAYLPVVGGGVALLLLIALALVLLLRRRKRKREEEELLLEEENFVPVVEEGQEEMEEWEKPELLNIKSEKTRELREAVRDFANENPELSAQMIKTWLNGGEADGSNE